ncbi:MAG: DNA topoisomerase IB [Pyrinomonadaceae bacterium]
MTNLERLQAIGIKRIGSPKRGFRYKAADGRSVATADLERIQQLRIPPAWTDVAISPSANGRLQAIGKDAAGRWQYLYHERHNRAQEVKKFRRLVKFAAALPKMRATVNRQLKEPGLSRERVLACVLRILSTCFMRPGSQVYASENGSYGIATLRPKHVKVSGDLVEFDFPGKSGVRQQRQIRDQAVAKVVRAMLKQPAPEVFKFQNGDGQFVDVKRRHINEYIKEVMGDSFSAKDFRTWAGTLICACELARAGFSSHEQASARKRKVVVAIKQTSEILGNTPAVCRSAYICPEVLSGFERGRIIDSYFGTLEDFISFRGHRLHGAEKALLNFLKQAAG